MCNLDNKALFLDRDGVVNVDSGYVHKSEDCIFISNIQELLKCAKHNGYLIIIVTNQAGIGRGYYTEDQFIKFMDWMNLQLGGQVDATYYCPFHPEFGIGKYKKQSFDRKPNPGMILRAIKDYKIDPNSSILVGDNITDIQAAESANISTRFLLTEKEVKINKCRVVSNLNEIIDYLKVE